MKDTIFIFVLCALLHGPLYAIKIQHNVKDFPEDVVKIKSDVNGKKNVKVHSRVKEKNIVFNDNFFISDAFLIRPNLAGHKVHIASNNDYIFKTPACKVIFLDSYSKDISPDLSVLTLYGYEDARKIHAYVGKTRVHDRDTFVTDLSGDELINFQIYSSFDDVLVTMCKKRLANLRKKHKRQIYHQKSSEVYLSKKLDDLITHVITSKKFPADYVIMDKNTIELLHVQHINKSEYIDRFVKKNYSKEKHHTHAVVLGDSSFNNNFRIFKNTFSIDAGWLLEAESWYKNTRQSILKDLVGGVYNKWIAGDMSKIGTKV